MYWSKQTGNHRVSVGTQDVNVEQSGRNGADWSVSHFEFLTGAHHQTVQAHHGEATLHRAVAECQKHLKPKTFDTVQAARLATWHNIPTRANLVDIARGAQSRGSSGTKNKAHTLEFNPHDRVTIGQSETVWSAPSSHATSQPHPGHTVLVHDNWLYAISPGLHIFNKEGQPVLSTPTITPALGANPWGFCHTLVLDELYLAQSTVVASYRLTDAMNNHSLHQCIGSHGLIALDPRLGIAARVTTDEFAKR
jgi:hypothetical protein